MTAASIRRSRPRWPRQPIEVTRAKSVQVALLSGRHRAGSRHPRGHGLARCRDAGKAARRRLHQADQDAGAGDRVLRRRPRHRGGRRPLQGRPRRHPGADLFRGGHHHRAVSRHRSRLRLPARCGHEHRPEIAGRQGDRRLHADRGTGGRRRRLRIHHEDHSDHHGQRLHLGRHPAGADRLHHVRLRGRLVRRACQAGQSLVSLQATGAENRPEHLNASQGAASADGVLRRRPKVGTRVTIAVGRRVRCPKPLRLWPCASCA